MPRPNYRSRDSRAGGQVDAGNDARGGMETDKYISQNLLHRVLRTNETLASLPICRAGSDAQRNSEGHC